MANRPSAGSRVVVSFPATGDLAVVVAPLSSPSSTADTVAVSVSWAAEAVVGTSPMTVEFPSEVSAPSSLLLSVGVMGVVVPAVIGVDAFLKSSEEMVSSGTHSPVDAERELGLRFINNYI